jgi:hypothetical protein
VAKSLCISACKPSHATPHAGHEADACPTPSAGQKPITPPRFTSRWRLMPANTALSAICIVA